MKATMAMELLQPGPPEDSRAAHDETVRRVLESRAFAKSPRLATMFEYICRHSLDGHPDELTEQQIGIHVFQRPPGYNSAEDTIVRGTARHLRQRLEVYYESEGANDPEQIVIPKGGYVASFLPRSQAAPPDTAAHPLPEESVEEPAAPRVLPQIETRWPLAAKVTCSAAIALAVVLPLLTYLSMRVPGFQAGNTGPAILWHALFQPGRKTLIVPGDAALDAYISLEQNPVTLEQYTEQSYQQFVTRASKPSNGDAAIGFRSMTPMSALRLVASLVQVPGWIGMPSAENATEIRYARDMNVADASNNNLILIGADTFNPWVTLYQPEMDFGTHWDYTRNIFTVTDRAPHRGEPKSYIFDPKRGPLGAKTIVALTDNTQGSGKVLLVEGTSMGTTYGGMRFLFDERLWGPVIAQATDRTGRLHNFEVLLDNDFLRGGVSNTRVVSVHVH